MKKIKVLDNYACFGMEHTIVIGLSSILNSYLIEKGFN